MRMKRALAVAALSVGLLYAFGPWAAISADDKDKDKPKIIKVPPLRLDLFQFGQVGLAGWIRGAGKPGQKGDEGQFGLYLQKNTKTANFAAAGGDFSGNVPKLGTDLNTLSFDIPGVPFSTTFGEATGYCNNGAPRYTVVSDAGFCFLGCLHGDKIQDPVTGWWNISFSSSKPFTAYPGCELGISGNIQAIEVILDEGNDLDISGIAPPNTGNSPGNVVLDNLTVNDKVIGRPNDDD